MLVKDIHFCWQEQANGNTSGNANDLGSIGGSNLNVKWGHSLKFGKPEKLRYNSQALFTAFHDDRACLGIIDVIVVCRLEHSNMLLDEENVSV
jgi:hypothetical protein